MCNAQLTLAQAFLPDLRARGFGRIIAIGSISIVALMPGLVLSNAVRAMLASWCKTLAAELHARRAAAIDTDRVRAAAIPAGRLGRPEEFGDIAAFLASPRAAFINGCAIRVDGGQTASL